MSIIWVIQEDEAEDYKFKDSLDILVRSYLKT